MISIFDTNDQTKIIAKIETNPSLNVTGWENMSDVKELPIFAQVNFCSIAFVTFWHYHAAKLPINFSCSEKGNFLVQIFVAASNQTRLDTRSKARRPIKVGIKGGEGRERAETRTLLVNAAHRLTWCNVSLMRQAVSRTQMWVLERMPVYGLN